MLFGKFIMGVDWGNSFFYFLIIQHISFMCHRLGMFGNSGKNNAQLGAYASIIIVSTSMLSGYYWPMN